MENVEAWCEAQEFARCKAKLSPFRMSVPEVVVDGKRFIQQDTAWLQRVDERGEERPVQVKEDENGIVRFIPEMRFPRRRLFQIKHSRTDAGEMPYSGDGRKLCEGLFITIDRFDLIAQRGEEQCVPPGAGGHIEDFAFGKAMKLLSEKPGRWRIGVDNLLREPCPLNADPDGAGYEGNRGMQFPQPQFDTTDREFVEECDQETFRQRFQEPRLLQGSNIDDTLSHFRIVDRVHKLVGQPCRLQATVQFQIDGKGLRTSAFFGRHAATATELQLFDYDLSTHGGIVEDRISGCQVRKRDGLGGDKRAGYEARGSNGWYRICAPYCRSGV